MAPPQAPQSKHVPRQHHTSHQTRQQIQPQTVQNHPPPQLMMDPSTGQYFYMQAPPPPVAQVQHFQGADGQIYIIPQQHQQHQAHIQPHAGGTLQQHIIHSAPPPQFTTHNPPHLNNKSAGVVPPVNQMVAAPVASGASIAPQSPLAEIAAADAAEKASLELVSTQKEFDTGLILTFELIELINRLKNL